MRSFSVKMIGTNDPDGAPSASFKMMATAWPKTLGDWSGAEGDWKEYGIDPDVRIEAAPEPHFVHIVGKNVSLRCPAAATVATGEILRCSLIGNEFDERALEITGCVGL